MKRKGETLTEFLAAVTVFGLMVSGIFEFIANQTENLADIKNKDDIIFYANWLNNQTLNRNSVKNRNILYHIDHSVKDDAVTATQYYSDKYGVYISATEPQSPVHELEKVVSFDWDNDKHILTVKKNGQSLSFQLQP